MPPHPRTRPVNAPARAERDARISARMQQGWTYDAIAKKGGGLARAGPPDHQRGAQEPRRRAERPAPAGAARRLEPALWLAAARWRTAICGRSISWSAPSTRSTNTACADSSRARSRGFIFASQKL